MVDNKGMKVSPPPAPLFFCRAQVHAPRVATTLKKDHSPLIAFNPTTTTMPISLLPVELLTRIFVECLHDDGPYLHPATYAAPLLLTLVCRRWRQIALQTTQLWCSLSAIEEYWGVLTPMDEARVNRYAAWLSRSGNRPLSLDLPFGLSSQRWNREWVQVLRSYSRRFKRLRLVIQDAVDLDELLDGANMLTSLALHLTGMAAEDQDLRITHPLSSLTTLFLHSPNVGVATLLDAVWANLTRLAVNLDGHGMDEFLGIMSRSPNLQDVVFGRVSIRNAEPNQLQLQPHSHPNLRFLVIVLREPAMHLPVSHILTLPGLLHLRVRHDFRHDWEDAFMEKYHEGPVIPPPSQRSFQIVVERNEEFYMFDVGWTNITHLEVSCFGDAPVFRTVMELCPNLQVLEMAGYCPNDSSTSLPTRLTYPSLRELFIQINAPLGNFLQMVTLPGLHHLTIRATDCGEHGDVLAMLLRSSCVLENLHMWETGTSSLSYWTEEEEAELLTSLPSLTAVKLTPLTRCY